jgi:hypothetical protein
MIVRARAVRRRGVREMQDAQRLTLVRAVHTAIYIVMAASTFVLVYAGLTGWQGRLLWVALGLLAIESVVFLGYGMKCPLTALAVRYGAEKGYAFDTFLPERATRYTFRFFGSLMAIGLALLALRWAGVLGG